jgi:hypothetical protein
LDREKLGHALSLNAVVTQIAGNYNDRSTWPTLSTPSVLPLPVGPDHHSAKQILILTMKLWKMKKSCDSDHEIMNLVEKNVGTPAILGRALYAGHASLIN